jgi:MFS family permease
VPVFGVVFVQLPMGWLSDRFDRRTVIMGAALLVGVVALGNVYAADLPLLWQIVLVTAFGSMAFPLYSLSIAQMNDHLESDQMLDASGKLVLLYGAGSAAGPLIAGTLIDNVGAHGFFVLLGAIHLAFGLFAVWRMMWTEAVPMEAQGDFVLVAPRASPIAAGVAMEISEEGATSPQA